MYTSSLSKSIRLEIAKWKRLYEGAVGEVIDSNGLYCLSKHRVGWIILFILSIHPKVDYRTLRSFAYQTAPFPSSGCDDASLFPRLELHGGCGEVNIKFDMVLKQLTVTIARDVEKIHGPL